MTLSISSKYYELDQTTDLTKITDNRDNASTCWLIENANKPYQMQEK